MDPRTAADNFGTMVCFHPDIDLGDAHEYSTPDEFLFCLFAEALGDEVLAEAAYSRLAACFDPAEIGECACYNAVDEEMLEVIRRKFVLLPVYFDERENKRYISISGFYHMADGGHCGWIYASVADACHRFGVTRLVHPLRKHAESLLEQEVAEYDAWLRG